MSKTKPRATSFTGVLPNRDGMILKEDSISKIIRQKIELVLQTKKEPPRLRRLSLTPVNKFCDDPYKRRSLHQLKHERSNSLPESSILSQLDLNYHSIFPTRNELVKTRSVTFHPETICLNAAADNDYKELEDILKNDTVDINYKNSTGLTMVHHAAASGSFECLKILIENEVEVNITDDRNSTPLDLAIRGGFFECALLLIDAGARVEKIIDGLQ